LPAEVIGLRFRASSLAPAHVVLSARLQLAAGDRERSEAALAEIVRWRREHQPGGQNCGSVFVNPVPGRGPDAVSAGLLIDSLGLRGTRFGTAWVSEKHANFIQAGEGGSAADVRRAIEHVRARVAEATGYRLRSEVRLVGFDDADPMSFEEHAA
jgi:UDP-N-acetylmuramate dehydrogenase